MSRSVEESQEEGDQSPLPSQLPFQLSNLSVFSPSVPFFDEAIFDTDDEGREDEDVHDEVGDEEGAYIRMMLSKADWQQFLRSIKNSTVYENRMKDFLMWFAKRSEPSELHVELGRYFHVRHDETDEDGNAKYAPTSLRSWLSVFRNYWQYTGLGDLRILAPLIEKDIGRWEKIYKCKKAAVFTKDQMGKNKLQYVAPVCGCC